MQSILPVEALNPAAKTYLSAIGAVAIYVGVGGDGAPVSVGVARDLDQALRHLRVIFSPRVSFGWVAWSQRYSDLVRIAQMPDLIFVNRGDGVRVVRSLASVVDVIELTARENTVTLTPHARVLERARGYAMYLDEALAALQQAGHLSAFNHAYKVYRLDLKRQGESVAPYWAVFEQLRAVIVRALVNQQKNALAPDTALQEIRKHFPWFTRWRSNGRKSKPAHKPLTKV